jgi:DNA-binding winged helix-turn-helix (wHTH) protein
VQAGVRLAFGAFELDPIRRRLTSSGETVPLPDRHFDVLLHLLAHAGQIVAKDDLLQAAWKDVAVGDNSLEQAISGLRRLLGPRHIETVPRRGYRFGAAVERRAARESDLTLDALLAPHRAFVEGRAALESFDTDQVTRARAVFEGAVAAAPDHASAHIGLANACIMQFESRRADPAPDVAAALARAVDHAREACRLDPQSGEAWSTLGFALHRSGAAPTEAMAAARRACALEPDNWRHQFRLASVTWGEERLRAAHRTLVLLPDFPLARWLAATVHVARQALGAAERELAAGLAAQPAQERFRSIALDWLLGLIRLAQGDERAAGEHFDRELASGNGGHLYGREIAANTWYAVGALRLRQNRVEDARDAFGRALEHLRLPMAQLGLTAADGRPPAQAPPHPPPRGREDDPGHDTDSVLPIEAAFVAAATLALRGSHAEAAALVDRALARVPNGNAGWVLPVEPLLHVSARPDVWAVPLARLRNRAA